MALIACVAQLEEKLCRIQPESSTFGNIGRSEGPLWETSPKSPAEHRVVPRDAGSSVGCCREGLGLTECRAAGGRLCLCRAAGAAVTSHNQKGCVQELIRAEENDNRAVMLCGVCLMKISAQAYDMRHSCIIK